MIFYKIEILWQLLLILLNAQQAEAAAKTITPLTSPPRVAFNL